MVNAMIKLNNNELLLADAFVMYMQMASYFDVKPKCSNPFMEEKMNLFYKMLPVKKQFSIEDICDRYIRKNMLSYIPKEMLSMRTEVIFKRDNNINKSDLQLVFSSWKYEIEIFVACDEKNKIMLTHNIYKYACEAFLKENGS